MLIWNKLEMLYYLLLIRFSNRKCVNHYIFFVQKKVLRIFNDTENPYNCSLFIKKNVMCDIRKGDVAQIDFENGQGIIIDENGQDIHFHLDNVADEITINSKITFEIELQERGLVAVNVKLEMEEVRA